MRIHSTAVFPAILGLAQLALGQSTLLDGITPPPVTPGSPEGSYALSDFESVNLFNGNLSFHLPLMTVGGRGEAKYTMYLGAEMDRRWQFIPLLDIDGQLTGFTGNTNQVPESHWWSDSAPPAYSPGVLVARRSTGALVTGCPANYPAIVDSVLTRLTFISGDGTEYELVDSATGGQPRQYNSSAQVFGNYTLQTYTCTSYVPSPLDHGTTFMSRDGSAVMFVADSAVPEYFTASGGSAPGSGWLIFRNGVRYRINSDGYVSLIQDRNGNQISLTYSAGALTQVVDPLNRTITFNTTYTGNSPQTATSAQDTISFKGFGGNPRSITVNSALLGAAGVLGSDLASGTAYALQSPNSLFGQSACDGVVCGGSDAPFDPLVISSVALPNGQAYQFQYNSFGELVDVKLPTGGEYRYEVGPGDGASSTVLSNSGNATFTTPVEYRRVTRRDVLIGGVAQGRTVYTATSASGNSTVLVDHQDANGNSLAQNKHYFTGSAASPADLETAEIVYTPWNMAKEYEADELPSGGGTPLRKTVEDWEQGVCVTGQSCLTNGAAINPRVMSTTLTLADANLVSKQTYGYDQYNNKTSVAESDYGTGQAGAAIRSTVTKYVTTNNGSDYTSAGIYLLSLPQQVTVYEADGTTKHSQTTYEYDIYSGINHAAVVGRVAPGLTAIGNDTRGNATMVSRWLNTTGNLLSTYAQYDSAGNVVAAIDANGNATTASYTDAYGSPNGSTSSTTTPTELSGGLSTFAFATTVTNALGQTVKRKYDYYLGRAVDAADVNGVDTSYYYSDSLDRMNQAIRAVGISGVASSTAFVYDDTNLTITAKSDQSVLNDGALQTLTKFDGLGRKIESRVYTSSSAYLSTTTSYDALNRVYQASNPGDPSNLTTTLYDALGRVQKVTAPDNSVSSNSYFGNQVTSADAACKVRTNTEDALGRLTYVVEDPTIPSPAVYSTCSQNPAPPAHVNSTTAYLYDVTDHLVSVTQNTGQTIANGGSQGRSFVYDSLGRLKTAVNPETGSIGYQFDNNDNLQEKDTANGNATVFVYDALNRVISKTYSGPLAASTPAVTWCYDGNTSAAGCPNAPTGSYMTGRLTMVQNSNSATLYSVYDALGRVTGLSQQTVGMAMPYPTMSYTYDLAGETGSITYPSTRKVSYLYDAAGRATNAQGLAGGATTVYASNISYAPQGAISGMQLGNGLWGDGGNDHAGLHVRRRESVAVGGGVYEWYGDPELPGYNQPVVHAVRL